MEPVKVSTVTPRMVRWDPATVSSGPTFGLAPCSEAVAREAARDACVVCASSGRNLVVCRDCGNGFHPFCCGERVGVGRKPSEWRCPSCRVCGACGFEFGLEPAAAAAAAAAHSNNASDPSTLTVASGAAPVCASCETAYHAACLPPAFVPRSGITTGWNCPRCVSGCRSCWRTSADLMVVSTGMCAPCTDAFAAREYCPICERTYREGDGASAAMLVCDRCDMWVHTTCMGMPMRDYNALNAADDPLAPETEGLKVICPRCHPLTRSMPSTRAQARRAARASAAVAALRVGSSQESVVAAAGAVSNDPVYVDSAGALPSHPGYTPVISDFVKACARRVRPAGNDFVLDTIGALMALVADPPEPPPVAVTGTALQNRGTASPVPPTKKRKIAAGMHVPSASEQVVVVVDTENSSVMLDPVAAPRGSKKRGVSAADLDATGGSEWDFLAVGGVNRSMDGVLSSAAGAATAADASAPPATGGAPFSGLADTARAHLMLDASATTVGDAGSAPVAFAGAPALAAIAMPADSVMTSSVNGLVAAGGEPPVSSRPPLRSLTPPPPERPDRLAGYIVPGAEANPPTGDPRLCALCQAAGDQAVEGRLIHVYDATWVHVNCMLSSPVVVRYEAGLEAGVSVRVSKELRRRVRCSACGRPGGVVGCRVGECRNTFHFRCALGAGGAFARSGGQMLLYCADHLGAIPKHVDNVAICPRPWTDPQLPTTVHWPHSALEAAASLPVPFRVGDLTVLALGTIVQSRRFASRRALYPAGYTALRYYWSAVDPNARTLYRCTIENRPGVTGPVFVIVDVGVVGRRGVSVGCSATAYEGPTPGAAVDLLVADVRASRQAGTPGREAGAAVNPRPQDGVTFFGLDDPAVVRCLEELDNAWRCVGYNFQFYTHTDLNPPENPSGAIRLEPYAPGRGQAGAVASVGGREAAGSSGQPVATSAATVASKSSVARRRKKNAATAASDYVSGNNIAVLFRKMKTNPPVLRVATSAIQGCGAYAVCDIKNGDPVVEYVGELIRSGVADMRERYYKARNMGVYFFRINERWVVDATVKGNMARFLNHSCAPNCKTRVITENRRKHIVIYAIRNISKGEELTYDYMLSESEDMGVCRCGAPKCRKVF